MRTLKFIATITAIVCCFFTSAQAQQKTKKVSQTRVLTQEEFCAIKRQICPSCSIEGDKTPKEHRHRWWQWWHRHSKGSKNKGTGTITTGDSPFHPGDKVTIYLIPSLKKGTSDTATLYGDSIVVFKTIDSTYVYTRDDLPENLDSFINREISDEEETETGDSDSLRIADSVNTARQDSLITAKYEHTSNPCDSTVTEIMHGKIQSTVKKPYKPRTYTRSEIERLSKETTLLSQMAYDVLTKNPGIWKVTLLYDRYVFYGCAEQLTLYKSITPWMIPDTDKDAE